MDSTGRVSRARTRQIGSSFKRDRHHVRFSGRPELGSDKKKKKKKMMMMMMMMREKEPIIL